MTTYFGQAQDSPTDAGDECVRLLTPDGRRVEHEQFTYTGTDADAAALLRDMILARRLDTEATALQRKGELALWPPCLGQEAAQIGSVRATRRPDYIVPGYREHAVAWAVGIPPQELLGTFRGTHMVAWDPAEYRFHPYAFVVGTQPLHATGIAMALQRDGLVATADEADSGAVLTYFGDGAMSQGDVNEAFVFAASANSPVVFFCQNNQYAISEQVRLQSRIPLARRAAGFGFPGVQVDGNDVLAVHAVTTWAMERARRGEGPTLIEAFTYRMGAHTTADDPTKYRRSAEVDQWRERDPIARLRTHLLSTGAVDDAWFEKVAAQSEAYAIELRAAAAGLPDPDLRDWFDRAYVDTPRTLSAQRADYEAYAASFAD